MDPNGSALSSDSDVTLMILLAGPARRSARAATVTRCAPKKFVSNTAFASSTVVSSAAPRKRTPALLTRTSRRPATERMWSSAERTESFERTSSWRSGKFCDALGSAERRLVPNTEKPSFFNARAIARPSPEAAPVTRATPFSFGSFEPPGAARPSTSPLDVTLPAKVFLLLSALGSFRPICSQGCTRPRHLPLPNDEDRRSDKFQPDDGWKRRRRRPHPDDGGEATKSAKEDRSPERTKKHRLSLD